MKKIKANICMFLGIICLPAAGAEAESFMVQLVVTITAAGIFIFFFGRAARLLAGNKETEIDVRKVRSIHEAGERTSPGMENYRVYISM